MDWVPPKSELSKESNALKSAKLPVGHLPNASNTVNTADKSISSKTSSETKMDELEDQQSSIDRGHRLATVTTWLEKICHDNVPSLQKSSTPLERKKARQSKHIGAHHLVTAMQWGMATMRTDIEEGPDVLSRVLQVWISTLSPPIDMNAAKRLKSIESFSSWVVKCLPVHGFDANVALVSATWIHGLRDLGAELSRSLWLETLQSILTQVDRAWEEENVTDLFPWLVWACEIPLALATKLSHLGGKDRMVLETTDRLNRVLKEAESTPELWLKSGGSQLRGLLACVVRCHWSMVALGVKGFHAPQRKSISKLIEVAVRFSDNSGNSLLNESEIESDDFGLWEAISEICSPNKKLERLLHLSGLKKLASASKRKSASDKAASRSSKGVSKSDIVRLPSLGFYSEKAELASMRKAWDQPGVRMAIDYSQEPMSLDILSAEGKRIISGHWDLEITRDGQALDTDIGWSDVCWFSDDDVDYLEIECGVEGVVRIQRQMMLIRDESLIFLCDTLLAEKSATWGLKSMLSVSPDFEVRHDKKHHEAELHHRDSSTQGMGDGRHALLLPLALPEWRRSPSLGKLEQIAGQLVLSQESPGTRLMSPLVVVPRKPSKNQPYTWRHLTVAEDLQIQSRETAQAYRVQVGKDQLIFYRSLAKTIRRSAMGLHINSEFYAARFDPSDGEFEAIVEIDSDE